MPRPLARRAGGRGRRQRGRRSPSITAYCPPTINYETSRSRIAGSTTCRNVCARSRRRPWPIFQRLRFRRTQCDRRVCAPCRRSVKRRIAALLKLSGAAETGSGRRSSRRSCTRSAFERGCRPLEPAARVFRRRDPGLRHLALALVPAIPRAGEGRIDPAPGVARERRRLRAVGAAASTSARIVQFGGGHAAGRGRDQYLGPSRRLRKPTSGPLYLATDVERVARFPRRAPFSRARPITRRTPAESDAKNGAARIYPKPGSPVAADLFRAGRGSTARPALSPRRCELPTRVVGEGHRRVEESGSAECGRDGAWPTCATGIPETRAASAPARRHPPPPEGARLSRFARPRNRNEGTLTTDATQDPQSVRLQKRSPNRTVLDFTTGITAVVGPNGSGKSNLVDAIQLGAGANRTRAACASQRMEGT